MTQPYVSQFRTKLQAATEKRAALILELYKADPSHDRIPALMAERWSARRFGLTAAQLGPEIDEVLAQTKNEKLKIEATYARAYSRMVASRPGASIDLSPVEAYLKLAPKDPRGATLLRLAAARTATEKGKTALEDRILKEFPDTLVAEKIQGIRQRNEGIGKPFELEFVDAISGSTVSIKKLKGKVVVIDFWATWCGPCIAEMPEMKELYSRYRDKGVEFIGVSLDVPAEQGGLDRPQEVRQGERDCLAAVLPGGRLGQQILLLLRHQLDSRRLHRRHRRQAPLDRSSRPARRDDPQAAQEDGRARQGHPGLATESAVLSWGCYAASEFLTRRTPSPISGGRRRRSLPCPW